MYYLYSGFGLTTSVSTLIRLIAASRPAVPKCLTESACSDSG